MKNERPTIGLLTNTVDDPNNIGLWRGLTQAAEELDYNLICVAGRQLKSPYGFEAQGNALYGLINEHSVDGLVIWASVLSHFVPREEIDAFCQRYLPLPLVSLGRKMDNIPMVGVNDDEGIGLIFRHLVEDHGYRRVALITGAEENNATERSLMVYTNQLENYGLAFDPNLVAYGDFALLAGRQAGREAMVQLLDQAQGNFDAVIAYTDNMALGALQVLQERGIAVPDEIAITGRDDIAESSVVTPPLTTTPINMEGRARKAMALLAAQLNHEEVPETAILPAELIVRQSCGCLSERTTAVTGSLPNLTQVDSASATPALPLTERLVAGWEQFLHQNRQTLPAEVLDYTKTILNSFSAALEAGTDTPFLNRLNHNLSRSIVAGEDVLIWHDVLSVLRAFSLPHLNPTGAEVIQAETLWQRARVLISEAVQRSQAHRQLQAEQQAQRLRQLEQMLNATFDLADMMDVLARQLPVLGVRAAYLALYGNPRQIDSTARLMLAFDRQGRLQLPADGLRFPATELLPPDLWPQDRRFRWVLEPLYFQQQQLGYLILEVDQTEDSLCEVLREQISSALHGRTLLQTVSEQTRQLEIVASLSERLTAILDLDALLLTLVNQVKESFNYYHAHVYLLDAEGENLVMTAGAGQAGTDMKVSGHNIPISTRASLVARAARQREIVSVENVRVAPDWLPNPLLPDTYAEMAVPIILEDEVVGVLDVQHDQIAALDEGDAGILRTLANQVAVSIRNARLFAQTESALAEVQATQQRYLQQVWEQTSGTPIRTYRYDRPGVQPISETVRQEAKRLAQTELKPVLTRLDQARPDQKSVVAPVTLGGANIGSLQLHETEAYSWTEDDLALIESILDQVAQTAENLRLFDETRQRAEYERLIGEITQKIRQAPNLEILAQTAAETLNEVLGTATGEVRLNFNPQAKRGNSHGS